MSPPRPHDEDLRIRFGLVLVLLVAGYLFTAFSDDTTGGTLSAIAIAAAWWIVAEGKRRVMRILTFVAMGGLVALATVTIVADERAVAAGYATVLIALVLVWLPVLIGRRMRQQERIGVQTILGALCIYFLMAQFFARLYVGADILADTPPLETTPLNLATSQYFSYVVLTTLGFGDVSPVSDFGRALVPLEALLGQLYLTTTMAFLIGNLGAIRPSRPRS